MSMSKPATPQALATSKPTLKPRVATIKYISDLIGNTSLKPFAKLGTGLGYKLLRSYTLPTNTNLIIGRSGMKNTNGNVLINGGAFTITIPASSSITFVSGATIDQRQFLGGKITGSSTSMKGKLKGTGTILNGASGVVELTKLSKDAGITINTALFQTYLSDSAYLLKTTAGQSSGYISAKTMGAKGYSLRRSWTLPINTNVILGFVSSLPTKNANGGELDFVQNYKITVPASSSITFVSTDSDFVNKGAMLIYLGTLDVFGKLLGTGEIMARANTSVVIKPGGSKAAGINIVSM